MINETIRVWKRSSISRWALAGLACASTFGVGCGAEGLEGEEPLGETQEGLTHSPLGHPSLGQAQYGIQWVAGQGPVNLVPIGNSACFLNLVAGSFTSSSDKVEIINNGTHWQLRGSSVSGTNQARAFCTTSAAPDRAGSWETGQMHADLGVAANRTCFLTAVWGNLAGTGEEVRTRIVDGRWRIDGVSAGGRASCIALPNLSPIHLGSQGSTSSQGFAGVTNFSAGGPFLCALTRVSGRFRNGGSIQVYNLHTKNDPQTWTWHIITTLNNTFPFPLDSPTGSGLCTQ